MINELTSDILFRCPCCQKLYCADGGDFYSEKMTEFQCSDCANDFYLSKEILSSGLYKTEKRSQHEFVNCSKCNFLKNKQSDECPSCGVIETRFQDIIKLENPRLFELNKLWNLAVVDIENDQLQQNFLNHAQDMSALNFAAQKYSELQKIIGQDLLTEKYLKQIELRLIAAANYQQKNNTNKLSQKWVIKDKSNSWKPEISLKNIFLLISFLGALFFIFNVVRPFLPSLNGVFVAVVVLSLGLWSLSKNQTKTY